MSLTVMQPDLFTAKAVRIKGETFDPQRDGARLETLLERVRVFLEDGEWRTLGEIADACRGSEASCSARIRDLRAAGIEIEKQYVRQGLWKYRRKGQAS